MTSTLRKTLILLIACGLAWLSVAFCLGGIVPYDFIESKTPPSALTDQWRVLGADQLIAVSERALLGPFLEITTLKAFVDGEEVSSPAPTLSRGTGTDGRDQVTFATAPVDRAVIAVSADAKAINADVLDAIAAAVSADMDGYLHAYLPISDPALLATLKYKGVLLAKMRARGRRNVDVVDAFELEWKAAVRWFEDVAKGAIVLNLSTEDPEADADGLVGSEPPVFGPPNDPMGDW